MTRARKEWTKRETKSVLRNCLDNPKDELKKLMIALISRKLVGIVKTQSSLI